jgi:hypothetical protein
MEELDADCPVELDKILTMGVNYENLKICLEYMLDLIKA